MIPFKITNSNILEVDDFKIKDLIYRQKLNLKAVNSAIEEDQLIWHGHVNRTDKTTLTRREYKARDRKITG